MLVAVPHDGPHGVGGASVAYSFGAFKLSLAVRVPIYHHIIQSGSLETGQLTYPAIVNFGLQRVFDVTGKR